MFKGLLPENIDSMVQQLLFTFAYWHALAKLCQHTSPTLEKLSNATTKLGHELRQFQSATKDLEVFETSRELSARQRQVAKQAQHQPIVTEPHVEIKRRQCKLNLNTPKFHALGDYVAAIAQYGTTDSFSTQTVKHST